MELTNTNENTFDPTPKLKSSPIPINFVSFNRKDYNCFNCGDKYVLTGFIQRYCKNCFSQYVNDVTDYNKFLDVHMSCKEHGTSEFSTQNIKECENCSTSYFKQIRTGKVISFMNISFDDWTTSEYKLSSNCYQISSGWIESLHKKPISVLHL